MVPLPDSWDGLHPLVIHFPIALLLISPLFVLLALIIRKHSKWFSLSALILMVIGTAFAYVAVSTGEAAGEFAERGGPVDAVLERHEELGELTRNVFTGITLLYAVALGLPMFLKKLAKPALSMATNGVILVLLLGGNLLLANTAHQGGRLVHEFGVHALMPLDTATATGNGVLLGNGGDHDDDGDDD